MSDFVSPQAPVLTALVSIPRRAVLSVSTAKELRLYQPTEPTPRTLGCGLWNTVAPWSKTQIVNRATHPARLQNLYKKPSRIEMEHPNMAAKLFSFPGLIGSTTIAAGHFSVANLKALTGELHDCAVP